MVYDTRNYFIADIISCISWCCGYISFSRQQQGSRKGRCCSLESANSASNNSTVSLHIPQFVAHLLNSKGSMRIWLSLMLLHTQTIMLHNNSLLLAHTFEGSAHPNSILETYPLCLDLYLYAYSYTESSTNAQS